jgi:NAD(P)-dependent dehydrogenase (short-subunit alcohol dehydrogenase family)
VGRAIAKRFAVRGYRIVLHANRSVAEGKRLEEQWNRAGVETLLVTGAIEEEVTVEGWIDQIMNRFGRLDVLTHAAAVWEPMSLEETSTKLVVEQLMSNTVGSFLCGQKAGLAMTRQTTGGAIIMVGDWALCRPYRDFAAYFTSKAAIPTLTRSLAVELAERNPCVRVNAVMPGPVLLVEGTPDATQQGNLRQCLLRRSGTADHVARAAVFLAEHEFLTGVCLPVDGGRSVYAGPVSDAIAHPSQF